MKRFLFLITAILMLATVSFSQKAAGAKVDPAKPVRDVFDRLIEGIKQADAAKVMSVYDNSERTLFFNNNGTATIGWETMKKNREESYTKTKNVSIDVTGVRVELLSPTAAYVTCKWKQAQEYEGKLESSSGRMTLVLKKTGKEWKVVHLHTSPDAPAANRPVLPSERVTPPQG